MAKLGSIPEFVYCPGVMGGRVTEEDKEERKKGEAKLSNMGGLCARSRPKGG